MEQNMKSLVHAFMVLAILAAVGLACTQPAQPVPEIRHFSFPAAALEPPSIDQQIFDADVIVVASLVSAKAAVHTVPGDPGVASTYLPKQVLRFRASEYLKGTGPNELTVEVVDEGEIFTNGELHKGYLTEAQAWKVSTEKMAQRNTTWDDRPGVLFLIGPLTTVYQPRRAAGPSGASSSQIYGFTLSNFGAYSNLEYSVDTLSRTWLPASEAASGSTRSTDGGTDKNTQASAPEYITDWAKSPPSVISQSALKTRILEINAMLAAGAGREGYEYCVRASLVHERYSRNWETPTPREEALDSGLAKGTSFYPPHKLYYDNYAIRTVSCPDADLFDAINIDDDTEVSNGHYVAWVTTRPLPASKQVHGQFSSSTP